MSAPIQPATPEQVAEFRLRRARTAFWALAGALGEDVDDPETGKACPVKLARLAGHVYVVPMPRETPAEWSAEQWIRVVLALPQHVAADRDMTTMGAQFEGPAGG